MTAQEFAIKNNTRFDKFGSEFEFAEAYAAHQNAQMREALRTLKSYNKDIRDGKINYRPQDHIQIADAALSGSGEARTQQAQGMGPRLQSMLKAIDLAVSELPDRSSPDDWPEAMLVTGVELRTIIAEKMSEFFPPSSGGGEGWKQKSMEQEQKEACARIYETYGNRLDLFFHDAKNNLPWGHSIRALPPAPAKEQP